MFFICRYHFLFFLNRFAISPTARVALRQQMRAGGRNDDEGALLSLLKGQRFHSLLSPRLAWGLLFTKKHRISYDIRCFFLGALGMRQNYVVKDHYRLGSRNC